MGVNQSIIKVRFCINIVNSDSYDLECDYKRKQIMDGRISQIFGTYFTILRCIIYIDFYPLKDTDFDITHTA